jgi:hypothetical protein
MRKYIFLCFEFSGFHRNIFSTQAVAEADRGSKAPRGTIQSEASSGAPSDPCSNPPSMCMHARSHLRTCASAAAAMHRLRLMRPRMRTTSSSAQCARHNATRMGASLVSSHRLRMQPAGPALSLPPARIARLLTCLPHSGPLSLPPSPHSREDDGDDAAAPGASAAAAAALRCTPSPPSPRNRGSRPWSWNLYRGKTPPRRASPCRSVDCFSRKIW